MSQYDMYFPPDKPTDRRFIPLFIPKVEHRLMEFKAVQNWKYTLEPVAQYQAWNQKVALESAQEFSAVNGTVIVVYALGHQIACYHCGREVEHVVKHCQVLLAKLMQRRNDPRTLQEYDDLVKWLEMFSYDTTELRLARKFVTNDELDFAPQLPLYCQECMQPATWKIGAQHWCDSCLPDDYRPED